MVRGFLQGADYEAHERGLQTQDQCTAQGIQFNLLVESRGGWGPTAKTWQALGEATAARSGEAVSVETNRPVRRLQREHAPNVLRRLPAPLPDPEPGAQLVEPRFCAASSTVRG